MSQTLFDSKLKDMSDIQMRNFYLKFRHNSSLTKCINI